MTIHNNVDQTFWIFYFLCVFGFLTQKQKKIDQKQCKTFKTNKKQTNTNFQIKLASQQKAHNQVKSQNIGSINA